MSHTTNPTGADPHEEHPDAARLKARLGIISIPLSFPGRKKASLPAPSTLTE